MIVVMKKEATPTDVQHMVQRIESLGLKAHVIVGTERTVIAAVGDDRKTHKESLESGPGVAEVMPILAPYKVASLEVKREPTTIRAGSFVIGNGTIGVIAGPCSVETEAQLLSTAKAVKAAGATALRGGAFKPRTSPYSFQGLKEDGLKLLATARDATGLAVVTEVVATEDVALVARYADRCNVAGALDTVRHKLAVLREHCETVGRDPATVTTTRLGSLFLVGTAAEADDLRTMLDGIGGAEFVAGCTIGTEDQVVEQVEAILDAGVQEPIFNLPLADPAGVRRVGTLLSDRFGAD